MPDATMHTTKAGPVRPTRPLLFAAAIIFTACGTDATAPDEIRDGNPVPTVASVELTPGSVTLDWLGATERFSVRLLDESGAPIQGSSVRWASTRPHLATVDSDGQVTALANGTAEITATVDSVTGRATVVVDQLAVALIFSSISPSSVAGQPMPTPVAVEAVDQGGKVVADWTDTVRLKLAGIASGATLTGDSVMAAVGGRAEFDVGVDRPSDGLTLRASSATLAAVESDPFDVWDHPVKVDSLVLSDDTLAIGGASASYRIWMTNIGTTVPASGIQGYVLQSGVAYAAGGRMAKCGDAPIGDLPSGECTYGFTLGTNVGGGLVPGPAEALLEVFGEGDAPFRDSLRFPITLIEFVPPPPRDVYFGSVSLESTVLTIGGPAVVYRAMIENDEAVDVPDVVVQGYVEQGATSRAAGGSIVNCGPEFGTVPSGGCVHTFTAVASNGLGGVGTLVPGPASVRLELFASAEGVHVELGEVVLAVTLVN